MCEDQQKVCGFLVVRKPTEHFDEHNRGVYSDQLFAVNGIYYAGVDRMEWFDIAEAFYGGTLPETVNTAYQDIINTNPDLTGVPLSREYAQAKKLLEYASARNEMIALYSNKLAQIKGEIVVETSRVEFLGVDYIAVGQGSLIYQGIFQFPELSTDWVKHLNAYGLFQTDTHLNTYSEFCRKQITHELLDLVEPIEAIAIEVYRVSP